MRSIVVAVVSLIVFIAAGSYALWHAGAGARQGSGVISDVAVRRSAADAVPLIDEGGHPTSLAALHGQWVVLVFGYASCPDICPINLAYLKTELHAMGAAGQAVRGVFVSVDPQRDTPATLGRYVRAFDPGFRAVTGTPEHLRQLAREVGAYFAIETPAAGSQAAARATAEKTPYTVAHSAAFFILQPDGQLAGTQSPPLVKGALAATLTRLQQAAAAATPTVATRRPDQPAAGVAAPAPTDALAATSAPAPTASLAATSAAPPTTGAAAPGRGSPEPSAVQHSRVAVNTLELTRAWVRLPPPGAAVTAAYVQVHNGGKTPLAIIGFALSGAQRVELHRSVLQDGTMRMQRVPQLDLQPGATVSLEPGALHLMVFGLAPEAARTQKLRLTLTTATGEAATATLAVREPQA